MLMERMLKSGKLPLEYANTDNVLSSGSVTSHVFDNVSLGPAGGDRSIIIATTAGDTQTRAFVGCTLDGTSMGLLVKADKDSPNSGDSETAIYAIQENTKTSAQIIVTMDQGTQKCSIHVYSVLNLLLGITPVDVNADQFSTGSRDLIMDVNCVAGDLIIAGAGSSRDQISTVWSSSVLEDYDAPNSNFRTSSASAIQLVTATPQSVSVNWPPESDFHRSAAAVSLR